MCLDPISNSVPPGIPPALILLYLVYVGLPGTQGALAWPFSSLITYSGDSTSCLILPTDWVPVPGDSGSMFGNIQPHLLQNGEWTDAN